MKQPVENMRTAMRTACGPHSKPHARCNARNETKRNMSVQVEMKGLPRNARRGGIRKPTPNTVIHKVLTT